MSEARKHEDNNEHELAIDRLLNGKLSRRDGVETASIVLLPLFVPSLAFPPADCWVLLSSARLWLQQRHCSPSAIAVNDNGLVSFSFPLRDIFGAKDSSSVPRPRTGTIMVASWAVSTC